MEKLEKLLALLLQATLRGRLLPEDRRLFKRHLKGRKDELRQKQKAVQKTEGPRCPACRLRIESSSLDRCPHCSVLFEVFQQAELS
jgi:hypothetical protein